MAPRALASSIACSSAASPLAVEIGVRLVEHDQKRIAVKRPRQAPPADAGRPTGWSRLGRCGCRNPSGSRRIISWAPAAWAAATTAVVIRLDPPCGRCFRRPCRRTDRPLATDSRVPGREFPAAIAPAPRRRSARCLAPARHTPTKARTSEVLPEPLGPMMPRTSPAATVKLTLPTVAVLPSGGTTVTFSAARLRAGLGSAVLGGIGADPGERPRQLAEAVARRDKARASWRSPFRSAPGRAPS